MTAENKPVEEERILLGALGAFLGTVIGIILIVALEYFNISYIALLAGFFMGLLPMMLYIKLAHGFSWKGALITILFIVAGVYLAERLGWAIALKGAYPDESFMTCFSYVPYLVDLEMVTQSDYIMSYVRVLVFAAFGVFMSIYYGVHLHNKIQRPTSVK